MTAANAEHQIQSSWRDNAAAWTDAVRSRSIASRALATDAAVLAALRDTGAVRVLDIGCGEGWLCRALEEAGVATTGFDATPDLVARAREAHAGDYRVLTYEQFAADPASAGHDFDAAVCNFSLLNQEVSPVLLAAAAVLRPRGALIIQTVHPFSDSTPDQPYRDGWRLEEFASLGPDFRTPMPWYFRTVGSWIAELTFAGFRLQECREPVHPETARPLSLLLVGSKPTP